MPQVVRFAQSALGKAIVLALFACGLWLHSRTWWLEMSAILAALTFLPAHRRALIVGGTLYWTFRRTVFGWGAAFAHAERGRVADRIDWRIVQPAAIVAALLFCVAFVHLWRRRAHFAPMRRPVVTLFVVLFALLALATTPAMSGVAGVWLWAFLLVLGRCVWFLAYSVIYPEPERAPLLQVGEYLPFWYGSATTPNPIPKGAGYLRKIEAKNADELAVCQLKALKLLFWAGVLALVRDTYEGLTGVSPSHVLVALGIDMHFATLTLKQGLLDTAAGHMHAWYENWVAVLRHFVDDLLFLSIWSHVLVACCRMAGFKALRNTWRPLEATSIADFWNRYFYYFKEVLVDVFFYPTFLRYFKTRPRLRKFAATLAAATFGNILFHYLRDIEAIEELGLGRAFAAKEAYVVYATLLGVGIGVSQLRARRDRAQSGLRRALVTPACVLGFFCVISVFDVLVNVTVLDRCEFVLGLAGVRVR